MTETTVPADVLEDFCFSALGAVGVDERAARLTSVSLVDADLRGLDSHGVAARMPNYVARLQGGGTSPNPNIQTISMKGSVAVLDGGHGLGQVAADAAVELATEMATAHGIGLVGVRHSNHLGALGYWSRQATGKDMVGFSLSGAAPRIAPWGGAEALLSTNPWSIAIPMRDSPPIVIDMSMGIGLLSALTKALAEGISIPIGLALDTDGRPTSDPADGLAGSILPFGQEKGAALNLGLEVLGSVLTGGTYGGDVPAIDDVERSQDLGHLFIAISVEALMPLPEFNERMDGFVRTLKTSRPAAGQDGVRIPGERGEGLRKERLQKGIPLGKRAQGLIALADHLDIEAFEVKEGR